MAGLDPATRGRIRIVFDEENIHDGMVEPVANISNSQPSTDAPIGYLRCFAAISGAYK